MAESSEWWDNTGVGDGESYTSDEFTKSLVLQLQNDTTIQSVIPGSGNNLAITNPAGTTIRVASGSALCQGSKYFNSANVDFTVTAPGSGSNYYTIVLQKDFTAQTVRLAQLGPDVAAPPAVTQTDGTLWEVSIATVRITSGGVITITDTRRPSHGGICRPIDFRQGGDSARFSTAGTTNYIDGKIVVQAGSFSSSAGSETVAFPKAFTDFPIVIATPFTTQAYYAAVSDINTTSCKLWAYDDAGAQQTSTIFWMAYGLQ